MQWLALLPYSEQLQGLPEQGWGGDSGVAQVITAHHSHALIHATPQSNFQLPQLAQTFRQPPETSRA